MKFYMKFLLALIFLTTPVVVYAHTGLDPYLYVFFSEFPIVVASLITIFSLYTLRHKSNSLLLLIDIIFSVVYTLMINFWLEESEVGSMMSVFVIPTLVVFAVIFGIKLFIKKERSKDVATLNKVFIHGIITGVITILSTLSFPYGSVWVLYSTNCDKNLILNSYDRETQEYDCIIGTAMNRTDSEFCNKFGDNDRAIHYCKAQVSIKRVESGDLSGCSYLKSDEVNFFYQPGIFGREKKIIDKCRQQ